MDQNDMGIIYILDCTFNVHLLGWSLRRPYLNWGNAQYRLQGDLESWWPYCREKVHQNLRMLHAFYQDLEWIKKTEHSISDVEFWADWGDLFKLAILGSLLLYRNEWGSLLHGQYSRVLSFNYCGRYPLLTHIVRIAIAVKTQ